MAKEIAVYKLQEWDMGEGEKKYSPLGILEAHYYFAKVNGGKFLFTTPINLPRQEGVTHVLLTLPNGEYGFLSKIIAKGTYPKKSNSSYTVPTQWKEINETEEQESGFNWIELEVVSKIIVGIENVPHFQSPKYMNKEEFNKYI